MTGNGENKRIHFGSPTKNERPTHRTGGRKTGEFSAASVAVWERIQKRAEGARLEKELNKLSNDNGVAHKSKKKKAILNTALLLALCSLTSFSKPAVTTLEVTSFEQETLFNIMDDNPEAVAAILNSISVGE